ncbi:MAG TPA: shikimate kinase [Anaeromyxobacter sp.]|nr:shikimate kinase [Anaeromyxobacter sp.]
MPLGPAEVLALTGMMGAGKSAVARELARLTGREVFSLDEEITRRAGKTIAAVFAEEGEARFRALERAAVAAIPSAAIADLGGGAFCDAPSAERLLAAGRVVFLEVSGLEAARRIGGDAGRPLSGRWEELYRARLPLYRRAHLTVTTDGLSPAEIARRILESL